jgi:NodT family efflux transporter outer membrane factor (OMF) lipoprotein
MSRRVPLKRARAALLILASVLAGCEVGPNYHRPTAPISTTFKEAAGWVPSRPVDALDKGAWWSMFNDPVLDGLERRVAISNQTVKEYEAAYREAHQIVAEARASFFPTLSAVADATRSRGATALSTTGSTLSTTGTTNGATTGMTTTGATGAVANGGGITSNSFTAALEATWAPDLWGKIRRTIESDKALAQASAADIANAKLSAQAALAEDYLDLRVIDDETRLYNGIIDSYKRFLTLTQDQVREGTQPQSAVLSAQTQLYGAQSSLIALGVSRAEMEHAIAILVGVAPADLTIAPTTTALGRDVPSPPLAVPSTLLQRRPDIAGAERRMASGNALIGVAVSAYFPDLTLSGDYGGAGSSLSHLFSASNTLWSLGADASETLLDFGLRRAQVKAAKAVYDEDVATYRETVLTALQGVEDELASLRIYQQQQEVASETEQAAQKALKLDLDEYREGVIDYTTVMTAQATALNASLSVLSVLENRLQASVLLVENLGGGWSTLDLPKS